MFTGTLACLAAWYGMVERLLTLAAVSSRMLTQHRVPRRQVYPWLQFNLNLVRPTQKWTWMCLGTHEYLDVNVFCGSWCHGAIG